MPGQNQDQVHVKSPFVQARPNAEQFFVHPYSDTHHHLLFASEDDPTEARRYSSRGLNPYNPHGDIEERPIPAKVRTTSTTNKPKLHGHKRRDSDTDPVLASKPLTEEAFDNMIPV
jgi:hypothetical protein